MKKLVLIFGIILLSVTAFSQERTVNVPTSQGASYWKYTGTTSDVLIPTTRDTVDLLFQYQGSAAIKKLALKSRFDMRTTADTTVKVSVFGKEFADDPTYTQIIAATTSNAVTANNTIQVLKSNATTVFNADSTITDEPVKTYRYYRVRYILSGNDSVGTGINIDEAELKLYQ